MADDPEWKSVFVGGVVNGNPSAVRQALDLGMPVETYAFAAGTKTPLLEAATRWDKAGPEFIAALLAAGADVNVRIKGSVYDGATALMLAARQGWVELVRQLLAAGADPNCGCALGTALSLASHPDPPRGRAAKRTDPDPEAVVRVLLDADARPGADALESAALFGRGGVARLLLAAGADPDGPGRGGTTPLQTAVEENRPELVALLLGAGADPRRPFPGDHADHPGRTPLEVARKRRLKKIVPLLEAADGGPAEPRAAADGPRL